MSLHRIFQTTAARLALRYTFFYAIFLFCAIGWLLWYTNPKIDSQVKTNLEREMSRLNKIYRLGAQKQLTDEVNRSAGAVYETGTIYLLVGPDNNKVAGNLYGWPTHTKIAQDGRVHEVWIEDNAIPENIYDDDAYWPVIAESLSDGSRLLLAQNVAQHEETREFADNVLIIMGFAILVAWIMGISIGRSILGRMDTISGTAGEIMMGDLSLRIPVSDKNDEFDALAKRLNDMLEKNQALVKGIRHVTDSVAHEMRSPLTLLRNRLEATLREQHSGDEYRKAIADTMEDIESLLKTFSTLLSIAQAEAGNNRARWTQIDLSRLMRDVAELFWPVAEEKEIGFEVDIEKGVSAVGNRDLLAHAVSNLIDNAIKYTPAGGRILFTVKKSDKYSEIAISDNGPGIPESERQNVLGQFVRLHATEDVPGMGLGLSLVNAIVVSHKGELRLEDANPGLMVFIRLPCRQNGN